MWFLIIPVVFFLLAELWLVWSARSRRAPEIEATIEAHERFRQAMNVSLNVSRNVSPTAGSNVDGGRRSKIDA